MKNEIRFKLLYLKGAVIQGIKYDFPEGPQDAALMGCIDPTLADDQDEGTTGYTSPVDR